jgi:hypothetical protein
MIQVLVDEVSEEPISGQLLCFSALIKISVYCHLNLVYSNFLVFNNDLEQALSFSFMLQPK